MKRLIYTPQVKAYILQTDSNQVVDISNDIVSGQVIRRLNAVSDATITLQNKFGKYLGGILPNTDVINKDSVLFQPMDRIVIMMSRVGEPFPILTGYLDETPTLQLYPDTITINASCSLKLLQNTYFDPGLPAVTQFFSQLGFLYDSVSGILYDSSKFGNLDIKGGIGEVLWNVLVNIGLWNPNNIHILELPMTFVQKIINIETKALKEENSDISRILARYTKLFSVNGIGPNVTNPFSSQSPLDNPAANTYPTTGNINPLAFIKILKQVGFNDNVIPSLYAIAKAESSLYTNAVNWDSGASGLFQILPIGGPGTPYPDAIHSDKAPDYISGAGRQTTYNGTQLIAIQDTTSGKYGSSAYSPAAQQAQGMSACFNPVFCAEFAYGISNGGNNLSPWNSDISRTDKVWTDSLAEGQFWLTQFNSDPNSTYFPNPNAANSTTNTKINTNTVIGLAMDQININDVNSISNYLASVGLTYSQAGSEWCAAFAYYVYEQAGYPNAIAKSGAVASIVSAAQQNNGKYGKWYPVGSIKPQLGDLAVYNYKNQNPTNPQFTSYNHIAIVVGINSDGTINTVAGNEGGKVSFDQRNINDLQGFIRPNINSSSIGSPTSPIPGVSNTSQPGISTPLNGTSPNNLSINTPLTPQKVAAISFFTQQQLTSVDNQLSQTLYGKRALSNDIPLIEWINDLVPSSGRVYCSAPNGDFYCFFPDYFNWFNSRTPYMKISSLETIRLNIQKSDTNLTTHVYGVGPIFGITSIAPTDYQVSAVASVEEEAFHYFINVDNDGDLAKTGKSTDPFTSTSFDPIRFLQKYGARPKTEQFSNIRTPALLWMATWMKFSEYWADQFIADAEFTFLPELFPGGLVNIDDQVQMFVNSVTHSFDMKSGFSTSAELMAAALPGSAYSGGNINQEINTTVNPIFNFN